GCVVPDLPTLMWRAHGQLRPGVIPSLEAALPLTRVPVYLEKNVSRIPQSRRSPRSLGWWLLAAHLLITAAYGTSILEVSVYGRVSLGLLLASLHLLIALATVEFYLRLADRVHAESKSESAS